MGHGVICIFRVIGLRILGKMILIAGDAELLTTNTKQENRSHVLDVCYFCWQLFNVTIDEKVLLLASEQAQLSPHTKQRTINADKAHRENRGAYTVHIQFQKHSLFCTRFLLRIYHL